MPIKITIHKEIILNSIWCNDEEFADNYDGDIDEFCEFIEEDLSSFIEECGGIRGLVQSVEVVKKKPVKEVSKNE